MPYILSEDKKMIWAPPSCARYIQNNIPDHHLVGRDSIEVGNKKFSVVTKFTPYLAHSEVLRCFITFVKDGHKFKHVSHTWTWEEAKVNHRMLVKKLTNASSPESILLWKDEW